MKFRCISVAAMALLILLACPLGGQSQGTIKWTVTFDGSPPIAPNHEIALTYYSESNTKFTPIGAGQFGRSGGSPTLAGFPTNGTAYLFAMFTDSLAVTYSDGKPFAAVSVDLAEFSTLYPTPLHVPVVGYRADGSTVTNDFLTDGIIDGAGPVVDFETFYFDSRFGNVVRLEFPTYRWSLDNMVLSTVPEPGVVSLAALALAVSFLRSLPRQSEKRDKQIRADPPQ